MLPNGLPLPLLSPPFHPNKPINLYCHGVERTNSKRAHPFKNKPASYATQGRLKTLEIKGGEGGRRLQNLLNSLKQRNGARKTQKIKIKISVWRGKKKSHRTNSTNSESSAALSAKCLCDSC